MEKSRPDLRGRHGDSSDGDWLLRRDRPDIRQPREPYSSPVSRATLTYQPKGILNTYMAIPQGESKYIQG